MCCGESLLHWMLVFKYSDDNIVTCEALATSENILTGSYSFLTKARFDGFQFKKVSYFSITRERTGIRGDEIRAGSDGMIFVYPILIHLGSQSLGTL